MSSYLRRYLPNFAYHGKYCGPGYSGGEFGDQANYSVSPTDELDSLCKTHDSAVAELGDLVADEQLLSKLPSVYGSKARAMEIAFAVKHKLDRVAEGFKDEWDNTPPSPPLVGIHTNPGPASRSARRLKAKMLKELDEKKSNHAHNKNKMVQIQNKKYNNPNIGVFAAPAAIGLSMRPTLSMGGISKPFAGMKLRGRQVLSQVYAYTGGVPSFNNAAAQRYFFVDPSNFPSTSALFTIGLAFLRFRFTKFRLFWRSSLATSVGGNVVMAYTSDANAFAGTLTATSLSTLTDSVDTQNWLDTDLICTVDPRADYAYSYDSGSTTPSDYRLGNQGIALISGASSLADGNAMGSVWIDYEVEFIEIGAASTIKSKIIRKETRGLSLMTHPKFERLQAEPSSSSEPSFQLVDETKSQ